MSFQLEKILSRYSLKKKLNLSFLSIFLTSTIILTGLIGFFSYENITEEVSSKLQSLAISQTRHLETYFEQNIERFKLITSRTAMRKALSHYNLEPNQTDLDNIANILKDAASPLSDLERICIFDLSGRVIVSTEECYVGRDVSEKVFFLKGKEKEDIYFVAEDGKYKLFVSGPIKQDGRLIGIGLTVVSTDYLKNIINNRNGLGKTGEILIAFSDKEGNRIYPLSRLFESQAVSTSAESSLTAEPMKRALLKEEKVFTNTFDYRNKKVMAVSSFVETGRVGLVAKIDRAEALAGLLRFFIIYFTTVFCFVLLFLFISRYLISIIVRPLEALRHGASLIQTGNLDYKLSIYGQDEISSLSQDFDKMVESLKESRFNIERKVEEQTKDLSIKAKELVDQKTAILNILEDIKKEKDKTEEISRRLKLATESAQIGIWEWDVVKNVITWDDQMYKIYGLKKGDFGGAYEAWQAGLHPDDKKAGDEAIQKALRGEEEFHPVFRVVWPKGEIRYVQAYALIERDEAEKPLKMIGVNFDITKEKEVDKAKSEFVSLASHQLRTPLSAINWYTEMLLNGDAGTINDEQKKYLGEVSIGNKRMVALVNALLNVSRLDLGTFIIEPEPTDITAMIKSVLDELRPQIMTKKLQLSEVYDPAIPTQFLADQKLLRMVFQNLLSNAVKYTPEAGSVTVSSTSKGEDLIFSVADSGMGIPASQKDKIFSKLFRADNARESDSEGTGLGLYIVKSVIEQSGGKVWFESVESKGSTFYVSLPLSGMKKKEGTKKLD